MPVDCIFSFKTNAGLSPQPQLMQDYLRNASKERNRYVLQDLGGNFIWLPTRFNCGTISIQYFLFGLFLADDTIPYVIGENTTVLASLNYIT